MGILIGAPLPPPPKKKVLDGYRLSQPQGCHDDLYAVILKCWALKPLERPLFNDFIKNHLDPLDIKLTARWMDYVYAVCMCCVCVSVHVFAHVCCVCV